MVWIKRNLYLVLSAAVGLILLGGAGYFFYINWDADHAAVDQLTQAQTDLEALRKKKPVPTPEIIKQVKDTQAGVRAVLDKFKNIYTPVPEIKPVDEKTFKVTLDGTIAQLQTAASNANVHLAIPDYPFSFSGLTTKFSFASNGITGWLAQMQDVKELCGIVFDAKVNTLESIHRSQVIPEETSTGGATDFLTCSCVTNETVVRIPYEIVVQGYSREIANILNGFLRSSNCIIVKNIDIGPGTGTSAALNAASSAANARDSLRSYAARARPGMPILGGMPIASQNPNTPTTLVSEGMLRAVILLDIVKPIAPLH